ncbi:hypothetical protein JCM11251_005919 [Rhodosporidiobolus azoricus]
MPFRHSPLVHSTRFSPSSSESGSNSSTPPPTLPAGLAQAHRTLVPSLTPSYPHSSSAHRPFVPSFTAPSQLPPREHASTPPPIVTGSTVSHPSTAPAATTTSYAQSLASPCFIHSHLDNTLSDFAKRGAAARGARSCSPRRRKPSKAGGAEGEKPSDVRKLQRTKSEGGDGRPAPDESMVVGSSDSGESPVSSVAVDDEEIDEDEEANSWTRQLAETAVSVREMSRQLGRARVVSHIQSVMIVTKARDNQLTKLTRELALWLMKTPRNGKDRGLVVYVDTQLQKSKRFDAAGMQRDHPELFRPLPSRRYSRTSSSASLATDPSPLRRGGAATPHHHAHGSITPLSMTGLNEALVKRNNSISSHLGHHARHRAEEAEEGQLRYWTNDMCRERPHLFDFVITLGGDGTVLYTSWLFQQIVPPVIPFALGSLGFLTNFDYSNFPKVLDAAIEDGVRVNLRMRFTCTVYRAVTEDEASKRFAVKSGKTGGIFMKSLTREGWDAIESGKPVSEGGREGKKDKAIKCFSTRAVESFEVLNDLVVDRGPSPYVSQLELFGDEHHMTTVQADGLTVSTPTGSTAYSLSAGGSLVHPEIPAILITPICPHTLSFRPMLLPDSMELRICVPYNSRSTAWASFDGRGRVELRQGDHIKVTASPYPFPTVCADKQSTDWFHSIARTLKWNERERQKSFVILEEGRKKPRSSSVQTVKKDEYQPTPQKKPGDVEKHATFADPVQDGGDQEDEDDVDDDEEDEVDSAEEEYDIDDISATTTNTSSPAIRPNDPHATIPPLAATANNRLPPAHPSSFYTSDNRISPPRDPGLSSGASSTSVDIHEDPNERFGTEPPRGRSRSRTRAKNNGTSGRVGSEKSDAGAREKSEARAFAVVGLDSGSSDESDHSDRE